MRVWVIADSNSKLSGLRAIVATRHLVDAELLKQSLSHSGQYEAVIVAVDLRKVDAVSILKQASEKLARAERRLFLIDQKQRLLAVQAYALNATHVLSNSISPAQLLSKLSDEKLQDVRIEETALTAQDVASAGADAFASMFQAVRDNSRIDVESIKGAGRLIVRSIIENGLSDWLSVVRRHHEGTYQHCLLVTGVAVDFGVHLNLPVADIERLQSAAMFHDIGKARVPLSILDKPGRLDERERSVIETHPALGYEELKESGHISVEILDAVRHHHEYLDGSGYPDRLCGQQISDIVRVLTICDVYAALIERRAYKPTLSRERAYQIVSEMTDKLEQPLVRAFREVALNR